MAPLAAGVMTIHSTPAKYPTVLVGENQGGLNQRISSRLAAACHECIPNACPHRL